MEAVFAWRYAKVGGISKGADGQGKPQFGCGILDEAGDRSEAEGEKGKSDESSHARHDKPVRRIPKPGGAERTSNLQETKQREKVSAGWVTP